MDAAKSHGVDAKRTVLLIIGILYAIILIIVQEEDAIAGMLINLGPGVH